MPDRDLITELSALFRKREQEIRIGVLRANTRVSSPIGTAVSEFVAGEFGAIAADLDTLASKYEPDSASSGEGNGQDSPAETSTG
jgi:hypothetical protein